MGALNEDLRRAIAERRLVEFKFFQHKLTVEPYALGVKDDQERLVCLHLSRNPTLNSIRLASMSGVTVLDEHFEEPRGDFSDRTLARLLSSVQSQVAI
jgi:hypothetical protein